TRAWSRHAQNFGWRRLLSAAPSASFVCQLSVELIPSHSKAPARQTRSLRPSLRSTPCRHAAVPARQHLSRPGTPKCSFLFTLAKSLFRKGGTRFVGWVERRSTPEGPPE